MVSFAILLAAATIPGGSAQSVAHAPVVNIALQSRGSAGRQQPKPKAKPKKKSRVQSAPKSSGARKKSAVRGPRGRYAVQCSGNVNYYGMFGNYMRSDSFNFRTSINWDTRQHSVAVVSKGPLFLSGNSYKIVSFANDVAQLQAVSTKRNVTFSTLVLDTLTGSLSGKGTIEGRFSKRSNLGRRRAEVDGICAAL